MENGYYDAVFAPAQAMFPLYFKYKPTGKDILVLQARRGRQLPQPRRHSIVPALRRRYSDRLTSKGYLNTAVWGNEHVRTAGASWSPAAIGYNDPFPARRRACGHRPVIGMASSRLQLIMRLKTPVNIRRA